MLTGSDTPAEIRHAVIPKNPWRHAEQEWVLKKKCIRLKKIHHQHQRFRIANIL
jgi:hypothetical protein